MWNFITFHIRRMRENAALSKTAEAANATEKKRKTQQEKAKARKEKQVVSKKEAEKENDDEVDLPEVDRDTKKALRQRK